MSASPSLLPSHIWETSYRHEDGDLVALFYVPALSDALQYDRMTGYFSAGALALAARGIERLIANGGRMRLIVGCTLAEAEIKAIEAGYDLRSQVEAHLASVSLTPPDARARRGLEALAWMVAQGFLDVKVAVPVDAAGKPAVSPGIYHEKVGILTDSEGNRISFSGSINETAAGWLNNRESFHVHCSWEHGREYKHVLDEVEAFARLWEDRANSTRALDFPEAAKAKLLAFLPTDDRFVARPPKPLIELPPRQSEDTGPIPHRLMPGEVCRVVWTYIRHAARLKNGLRVGEATSVVEPWPHQRHTFKRLYDSWPCRLLLCDEVGLGKTISAALLIRQAWLAGLARRILIMTPKGVLIQWQNELYEKFNLNVPVYDGQKLVWRQTSSQTEPREEKVERTRWHEQPMVLCSSHLMRHRDRARELLQAQDWDLVILDEAHHARRKSPGTPQEGGPNALLQLMQQMQSRCRSLLLLTATPMQVHPVEIWDLLNLLGLPPRWAAHSAEFVRYFQLAVGNPSQVEMEYLAGMFRAVEATYGPVSEDVIEKLLPQIGKLARERTLRALRETSSIPLKRLTVGERQAALEILRRFSPIRYRMSRHTRGLLRLYHQRGLLQTPIAQREVRDVPVELNTSERALYEAVEDYISTTYNQAAPEKKTAIGFVMTIYHRRLASCFFALRQTLNNHLEAISKGQPLASVDDDDLPQSEIQEELMDEDEAAALATESLLNQEQQSIRDLLKRIAKLGTDTKAKQLKLQLEEAFAAGYESVIVFTQYTDTMDYLKEYVARELPGIPIACYSGKGGERRDSAGFWTRYTKEGIKRAFKDGTIRLLICTDAAGEGLNFQFCGALVNYDLPWNPMKVEQRIGRIDRIGQRYPVIRVVNLAYKDTVEADVFFSLGERINLFQGIVGKLQPILSRLPQLFERVALQTQEQREAARQRFLTDINYMVDEELKTGFDIDEVAAEVLEMPELPPPSLTLAEIDQAMNRADVRPAGMEWEPRDPGSYELLLPGMAKAIRVTTNAQVFDESEWNHELLSPGGEVFQRLQDECSPSTPSSEEGSPPCGNFWIAEPTTAPCPCEFLILTDQGARPVESLQELLASMGNLPSPGPLEEDERAGMKVRCIG